MARTVTLLKLPNGVMASSFGLKSIMYSYFAGSSIYATQVKGYGLPEYMYILGRYNSGSSANFPSVPSVAAGTMVYSYTNSSAPRYVGTVGTATVTYYTVTTSPGTGGSMSGGGEFVSGSQTTITATPKSGYVVDKLNGAQQDLSTGSKSVTLSVNSDFTVTASFKAYYNLSFSANGGSGAPSGYSYCFANTAYSIPTKVPTRSGYKFLGWATSSSNASNGVVAYEPGDNYSRSSVSAGGTITLYAAWKRYTLTYNANGGSSTPSSQSYYGSVTLAGAISYSGRNFLGWKIGSNIYAAGSEYNLTSDVTAIAQWTTISIFNDNTDVGKISLFDVTLNRKVADEQGGCIKYSGETNHLYRVDVTVSNFLYEDRGMYVNGDYIKPFSFTFSGEDVVGTYYFAKKPLFAFSVTSSHGDVQVSPSPDSDDGRYARGRVITMLVSAHPGYVVTSKASCINTDNRDVYNVAVTDDEGSSGKVAVLEGIAFNTEVAFDYSLIDYTLLATIDSPSAIAISNVSVTIGGVASDVAHYGDEVVFSATVNEGYLFAGWYDKNGNLVSTDQEFHAVIDSDLDLVAKAMVEVCFSIDYESADGNETCTMKIDDAAYSFNDSHYVILGNSFKYEFILGQRTDTEMWYLDSWQDPEGNFCIMPLSGTETPEESRYIKAFVKPKERTRRVLTIDTMRFGSTFGEFVEGTPYSVVGDYAPPPSGAGMLGTTPGRFSFYFYGIQYVKLTINPTVIFAEDSEECVYRGLYENEELKTQENQAVILLAESRSMTVYYGSVAPVRVSVAYVDHDGSIQGNLDIIDSTDPDASIDASGQFADVVQGFEVTVRAVPLNGYEFKGWYVDTFTGAEALSFDPVWTFTLMYARTVYAKFVKNAHSICEWEGDNTPKAMEWRSKTYESSKPFNPSSCRVDALGYREDASDSLLDFMVEMFSAPDSKPTASVRLTNIQSQNARRLPVRRPERYMQIAVMANVEIDSLLVGTSMRGLA